MQSQGAAIKKYRLQEQAKFITNMQSLAPNQAHNKQRLIFHFGDFYSVVE
jgi:hypothetical protein